MAEFGLQLSRRLKEQVVCEFDSAGNLDGDGSESSSTRLVVTVMEIRGNRVKLAFNAPASVSINRAERLENGVGEAEASLMTLELPAQSPEVEKGEAVAVACA
jgi:sRNA-binding carbon storage regulator CsrA